MDKKLIGALFVLFFVASVFALPMAGGRSSTGIPNPDIPTDVKKGSAPQAPDMTENESGTVKGMGKYITEQIVEDKVKRIKDAIASGNFTGRGIASIAKEIGVSVREYALVKVQEIRRTRLEKMHEMKPTEIIREGKRMKYDAAVNEFGERMNLTIERLKEKGMNTSDLEEMRDAFFTKYIELQESDNPDQIAQEMKTIANQFRESAREKMGDEADTIEAEISEELEAKPEIKRMRTENWQHLKEVALMVFDKNIASAEHVLTVFEEKVGLNVSELREKLDEVKGMRTELEAAYDSENRTEVIRVNKEIRSLWIEFRKMYSEVMRKQVVTKTIERVETVVSKSEKLVEMAKKKGIDTAEAEVALQEMKQIINDAKVSQDAGEYEKTKEDIKTLKNRYREFATTIRQLVQEMKEG
ncbi:MAG: hypothetical protein J7K68_01025 [Candidatus Diapherotrites archaeon]|nr:hypothetical protein [Candidatus Diapherotrites archaeon]